MRVARVVLVAVLVVAVLGAASAATPLHRRSSTSAHGTGSNAPYVDISERVDVPTTSEGAVSGAPTQRTVLSAAGEGKTTVKVPMSSKNLKKHHSDPKPTFENGTATFDLDLSGPVVHTYKSDFAGTPPLTVTTHYELNGKTTTASAVKHKSGTLDVTYTVTNTAQQQPTVSFLGFNGAPQTDAPEVPVPVVAHLAVTLPKKASNITAPKATTAVTRSGTKESWTFTMVPPLGPLSYSASYSMKLSRATIPEATLDAKVIVPSSLPAGKATDTSTKAVGVAHAAAASASILANEAITNLQTLQSNLLARNAQSSDNAVTQVGDSAGSSLPDKLGDDITNAQASLTASLTALSNSLAAATTNAQSHANDLMAGSAAAHSLATLMTSVATEATAASDSAHQVAIAASDAATALETIQSDLDAFAAPVKLTPEWLQTKSHVDAALLKAKAMATLGTDAATAASKVATDVQAAQTQAQALATTSGLQVFGFEASVLSKLQHDVLDALNAVNSGASDLENKTDALGSKLAAGHRDLTAVVQQARDKLSSALAGAAGDAASALESAEAGASAAAGNAQASLANANADYAQLLGTEMAGMDHALPGGNATGARTEAGHYHYKIAGS
jgi:hypothetical protein